MAATAREDMDEKTDQPASPLAIDESKRGSLVTRDLIVAVAEEVAKKDDASGEEDAGSEASGDEEAKNPTGK